MRALLLPASLVTSHQTFMAVESLAVFAIFAMLFVEQFKMEINLSVKNFIFTL